jgi:hypothetical protein
MNRIVPIIIPIHSSEPSRCPECGKTEDIKQVCRHCGHEYRDEEGSAWWGLWLIVGIVGLWALSTVGYWLMEQDFSKPTLLEVLKAQGEFFRGLRIW